MGDSDKENMEDRTSSHPRKRCRQTEGFVYEAAEKNFSENIKYDAEAEFEQEKLKKLVLGKLRLLESSEALTKYKLPFASPTNIIVFKELFGSDANKEITIRFINDIINLTENNHVIEILCEERVESLHETFESTAILRFNCLCKNNTKLKVIFLCSPDSQFEEKLIEVPTHDDESHKIIFIAVIDDYVFDELEGWIKPYTFGEKVKLIVIETLSFSTAEIFQSNSINNKWGFFLKLGDILTSDDLEEQQGLYTMPLGQAFTALRKMKWSLPELARYEQIENFKLKRLNEQRALDKKVIADEQLKIARELIADGRDVVLVILSTGLPVNLAKRLTGI